MVLDCSELRRGMRCSYKGKTLIYQYDVCGVRPYYVFFTERGAEKRLSQPIVKRDVWVEVEEAIASTNANQ